MPAELNTLGTNEVFCVGIDIGWLTVTAGMGVTGVNVEIVTGLGLMVDGIPGRGTGIGIGTGTGATFGKEGGGIGMNAVLSGGGAEIGSDLNVDFATVIIDGAVGVAEGCFTVFDVSVKSGMELRSISSKNPDSLSAAPSISWPSALSV